MINSDVIGRGLTSGALTEPEVEEIVVRGLASCRLDGKRVLVLIPDATRTFPVPLFHRLLVKHLLPRARGLDFLIALGTHTAMTDQEIDKLVGGRHDGVRVFNHAWDNPDALTQIGTIAADEIATLTGGLMRQDVPVRLNRMILEYDHLLVCGPVFPHEVVGFSGGNKYFFPGIAGPDIINFTHWVGALVTSFEQLGQRDTPVRRVIDRAAAFIPVPRHAICSVVTHDGIAGVFVGSPEQAYASAADISAGRHVVWVERPFKQVFSVLPAMYDEIWVGSKGMYKMEPAIADGGEVILYGPHIRELSRVHGKVIKQIGYHVRDYFLAQWDRFKHLPWGVIAHSTHLRGIGTYENGIERPRIQVTLATGIPEQECRAVNLGYRDPASIDPRSFAGRESEGVLLVPRAGEYLYRLQSQRR